MEPLVLLAAVQLILLHQVDGREILVNPTQITSLYAALPSTPNRLIVPGARCVIGMADAKIHAVIEPCATVRQLIEGSQ